MISFISWLLIFYLFINNQAKIYIISIITGNFGDIIVLAFLNNFSSITLTIFDFKAIKSFHLI